jgi:hypothetical protein
MLDHNREAGQAHGPGGADVVGAQRLDHRAAHQPRHDGDLRQGQDEHRPILLAKLPPPQPATGTQAKVSAKTSW